MAKFRSAKVRYSEPTPTSKSTPRAPRSSPSSDAQNLIHYLLNHIGDEVMLIDQEARIVFVNDATVHGLGLPRETLLRRRVTDFFQKRMSIRTWQKTMFKAIKNSPSPIAYRVDRETGDGQKQIVDITAVYMPYKSEEYVLSVARDRTSEIALQQRVRESEDLYRLINEGAGDGIFACDLKGNLSYVNPALESLVGVKAPYLKGRKFLEYIAKDSLSRVLEFFNQAKAGKQGLRAEIDLCNRKGELIPVEINVAPLYKDDAIVSIHAVVRDIRHRRHLELILRQTEKMQAIQSFVAGMAKEIRGPLFAVMSLTKRITERYKNRDFEYIGYSEFTEMMRALEEIHSRARHSYETTERLIDLNKKRSGLVKETCFLNEILTTNMRLRQSQLRMQNIKLKFLLTKRLPSVRMGRIELNQVLDNVFINAIQAMPGGGQMTVRTRFIKSLGQVEVDVQDTGVGISAEVLPHIFEPFFTTKQQSVGKNSGLGLPIAHELLKAVQGEIRVQSSLRQGTTITIAVPVAGSKGRR